MDRETIFALASGRGVAGIAVIRISGPEAAAAVRRLAGGTRPAARRARLVTLSDPDTGAALDEAIVIWFPKPASFTGEDVAELHVHGGRAVVDAVAGALGRVPGLRPAEAGEFTRRAFDNGKLDLTRAEGLADLVAAETEAQRAQALAQMGGALAERFDGWRAQLVGLLAHVETAVDFADEEVPKDLLSDIVSNIKELSSDIRNYLDDRHRGERLRDGLTVAILGAPNVGKSSIINYLVKRDAAIVSATAGTTRDIIEVHLDLGGLPIILLDTAGLRETADSVESEGVRRAEARARDADLRLCVFDATHWPILDPATEAQLGPGSLPVLNKADLTSPSELHLAAPLPETGITEPVFAVSAHTGEGIPALLEAVEAALRPRFEAIGPAPLTRARHRQALEEASAALARAAAGDAEAAPELLAEDLRLAARAIGRVTGQVDVEDVLDRIFAEFCIGK